MSEMNRCESCGEMKPTNKAYVNNRYYRAICADCMPVTDFTSSAVGYDRRRQYEDNAQDTIQPFDAAGKPNPEFYRLYPTAARKTFSKDEIDQVKRKL